MLSVTSSIPFLSPFSLSCAHDFSVFTFFSYPTTFSLDPTTSVTSNRFSFILLQSSSHTSTVIGPAPLSLSMPFPQLGRVYWSQSLAAGFRFIDSIVDLLAFSGWASARIVGRQHVRKAKKKQVKDELDRLKQAEKKKRRLEKALATSAAIISELEKKKQKKKEEQQRLDEEGAAIAEAVALRVLLGEDSDDSCKVECKTCDYNHNLDFFMGGKRACFPNLNGGTWSVTAENGKWSFSTGPYGNNVQEPLYEGAVWDPTGFSVDLIAAQAVRSLQIAEDANEDRILF